MRRKYAELIDPASDADTGEIEEPVAKKPARAKATIKRPAGIVKGAEPPKKRPATEGAEPPKKRPKHKKGDDCTAIVPVDDPSAKQKDRNKWLFLLRNKDTMDQRVLQLITRANQKPRNLIPARISRRFLNAPKKRSKRVWN